VTDVMTNVPNDEDVFEVLLTPREAAGLLRVSTRCLITWSNQNKIRCTRTHGGHRRFYVSSIRAALRGDWEAASREPAVSDLLPEEKNVLVDLD
jgi:excisionase family DNA binding protein